MDKKRVYTYIFANGDKVTVDEAALGDRRLKWDKWMEILNRLDLDEQANDKKETRRHCSYDSLDPDGSDLGTDNVVEDYVMFKEMYSEFIGSLTDREFQIYLTRYAEGMSQVKTAERWHVKQCYIHKKDKDILAIFNKIKKNWSKR